MWIPKLTLLTCASALALGTSRPAHACVTEWCLPSVSVAPANGQTLPSNAPALVAQAGTTESVDFIELSELDGGAIAATQIETGSVRLLRLDTPLVLGRGYRVRATSACLPFGSLTAPPEPDAGTDEDLVTFTAGASSPSPTTVGSVTVGYSLKNVYFFTAGPGPGHMATAQLTIEPSAELLPYLPVTQFSTSVDNEPWSTSPYGRGTTPMNVASAGERDHDFTMVHAACGSKEWVVSSCSTPGTTSGKHQVQIKAHIAGATVDPAPLVVEIDLQCPPEGGDPANGGGCSMSAGRATSYPKALALLGFACVLLRSRRQRWMIRASKTVS